MQRYTILYYTYLLFPDLLFPDNAPYIDQSGIVIVLFL